MASSESDGKKGTSTTTKVAAGVVGVAAVVLTGGVALAVVGGAVAAGGAEVATNPDGKITKAIESVPVAGYAASAIHATKGDTDRAKRAAAKCTNSTVVAGVVVGAAAATVATGGATAVGVSAGAATAIATTAVTGAVAAGAVGAAGAAGGAAGVFAESNIAKSINDENIKDECLKGTAADYAKGMAKGAVKGAVSGATAGMAEGLSAGADHILSSADQAGGIVADAGEVVETAREIKSNMGIPMADKTGVEKFTKGMVEEGVGGLKGVATDKVKDEANDLYNNDNKEGSCCIIL